MTTALTIGPVQVMVQNTIYALPSKRVLIYTDGSSPTIQQSSTVDFTANTSVTLTAGQAELAGGFIRCTNLATCNIYLKAA